MQITSRFTVALHILACADFFGGTMKVTGDFLASSIGANPALVRKILSQLRDAGLVEIARGTGGVTPAGPLGEMTLLDVYRAVEPVEGGRLFRMHEHPNPLCPVGRSIQRVLSGRLGRIECAMEEEMRRQTVAALCADIRAAAQGGEP